MIGGEVTMGARAIHLLLVEDSPADAKLFRRLLARASPGPFEITAVDRVAAALDVLQRSDVNGASDAIDLVLLDLSLPDSGPGRLDALRRVRAAAASTPILLLTGLDDEEVALCALREGAQDYLVKRQVDGRLLTRAIRYALERQRSEEALRQRENEYRAMFELAGVGKAQAEPETGLLVRVNSRLCEMTGYEPEELLGRTLSDLTHPADRAMEAQQLDRLWRGRIDRVALEKRYLRKNGTVGWALLNATLLRDPAGRPLSTAAIVQDITDRKRLEEKLARQAAKLRDEDRRKDEFLAMLAHELRNPLAAISSAGQVLHQTGPHDELSLRMRGIILHQVEHLSHLVDDLLDISRVLRGKVTLRKQPLDLRELAARAFEGSRLLADSRHHELVLALPPEPCWLEADPTRVEQVIGNLLSNAAKFTEPGGCIRVAVERGEGWATLRVADTGKGIPREFLPRVFDLFTQVEPSLDRSQGGLGIGLTLVQSLVELHGGRVTACSAGPGQGSEFVVRLPLLAAEAIPTAPPRQRRAPQSVPASVRILVVEDNQETAESLEELLRLWGHQVLVAPDGPAALDAMPGYRPEVVLLDLGLPGMDGCEVARRLRQQPGAAGARMIALTGYGQEEDRQRTREAGFDEHLVKPVSVEMLKRAVSAGGGSLRQGADC